MTISTTASVVTYQGNSSNRTFTFSFPILQSSHLKVYVTDRSVTPMTPTLVDSSDYTLVNNIVTYPSNMGFVALPATKYITLKRVVPVIQERNFSEQSGYYMEDLEGMGDYLTQIIQQLNDDNNRSVKVPLGSGKNPDTYMTDIETINTQSQQVLTQIQELFVDVPAIPFHSVTEVSSDFTATAADNGVILNVNATSTVSITLPRLSLLATAYTISIRKKAGTNKVLVNAGFGTDFINGQSSYAAGAQNRTITFVAKRDTLEWIPVGTIGDDVPFTDVGTLTFANSGTDISIFPKGSLITVDSAGGAISLTLPLISKNSTPLYYYIKRVGGTAGITLTRAESDTINAATSYVFGGAVGDYIVLVADYTSPTANTWTVLYSMSAILDSSITTAKIANQSITAAKLDAPLTNLMEGIPFQAVSSISTTATLTSSVNGSLINVAGGTVYTITLPDISTLSFPFCVTLRRNSGASAVTISRAGSNTINGVTSITLPTTVGASVMLVPNPSGSAWYSLGFNA